VRCEAIGMTSPITIACRLVPVKEVSVQVAAPGSPVVYVEKGKVNMALRVHL